MPNPLFVFDFDGVVADSLTLCLQAARDAARHQGLDVEIPPNVWEALDNVTFDALGRHLGLDDAGAQAFAERIFHYTRQGETAQLFEGMPALLDALADQGTVCVLSASHRQAINRTLATAGVQDSVSTVLGGDTPGSKAQKLRGLVERYRVNPEACWMAGDAVSDIAAARAVGCQSAAVSWGWQSMERLQASRPDCLVDTPEQLQKVLMPHTALA